MDPMFRKVVILVNGKARKAFICKCVITGEDGSSNYCNIKSNTFKWVVKHLQKQHQILLPDSIICPQHEVIMMNTFAVISHFKEHTLEAAAAFNCQEESDECSDCKKNLDCIKMCRPGMSCAF